MGCWSPGLRLAPGGHRARCLSAQGHSRGLEEEAGEVSRETGGEAVGDLNPGPARPPSLERGLSLGDAWMRQD